MKAIVYTEYGPPDVLQLKEVEKPAPKDNEVLVKIHAASVNYSDWEIMNGESVLLRIMNGITKPRKGILGDDIAGQIEAVGNNVKRFRPGDDVFGICIFGAFAEYVCVPENNIAHKPVGMTYNEAAAFPIAAITALQGLRNKGRIRSGYKVLINGSSGGVGMYAVQIAKSFGAEVTGVCSAKKIDFVASIGADHVIDYTQEDFVQSGRRYDLIFAIGGYRSIFEYKKALNPNGVYVCAGGSMAQYFQALLLGPLISLTGSKRMRAMYTNPNQEDYEFLIEHFEAGKVVPVIDRCYPLSEVPEALRYYGEGCTRGKLVITVEDNAEV